MNSNSSNANNSNNNNVNYNNGKCYLKQHNDSNYWIGYQTCRNFASRFSVSYGIDIQFNFQENESVERQDYIGCSMLT